MTFKTYKAREGHVLVTRDPWQPYWSAYCPDCSTITQPTVGQQCEIASSNWTGALRAARNHVAAHRADLSTYDLVGTWF